MIPNMPPPPLPFTKPPPQVKETATKIPDLTSMESELLKQKHQGAIERLYLGQQCPECGNRFTQQQQQQTSNKTTAPTINRYARHLDWHFRQNNKNRNEANKAHSRAWYYSLSEWMLYEELSDEKTPLPVTSSTGTSSSSSQQQTMSSIDPADQEMPLERPLDASSSTAILNSMQSYDGSTSNGNGGDGAQGSGGQGSGYSNSIRTCPASDDIGDSCCICNDPFEIFWFADKEEWHFKDALRVDNRLYHPICFEDAREVRIY